MATSGAAGGGVDLFLHVKTKRAGKIKGEGSTKGHEDDIELTGWSWGALAGTALGATVATARRSYRHLEVVKAIDSSSVGLMSALATNDEVKEAVLAMRKAGGAALDYYKITIAGARVVSIALEVDAAGGTVERVAFSFTKVDIEYKTQQSTGGSGGSFSFSDEVLPQ